MLPSSQFRLPASPLKSLLKLVVSLLVVDVARAARDDPGTLPAWELHLLARLQESQELSPKKSDPLHATPAEIEGLIKQLCDFNANLCLALKLLVPGIALKGKSARCYNDTIEYLVELKEGKLWALKMLDSTGKLEDGLLAGNLASWGNYEQCLSIETSLHRDSIQGRYCFTKFKIQKSSSLNLLVRDARLQKIISFLPFFRGICHPSTCSVLDIKNSLVTSLNGTGVEVDLNDKQCSLAGERDGFDNADIAVIFILCLVVLLCLLSTAYDLWLRWSRSTKLPAISLIGQQEDGPTDEKASRGRKRRDRVLASFSLYSNGKRLLDTSQSPGELSCLHGIRCFTMSWIILGHTFTTGMGPYYTNLVDVAAFLQRESSQIISNSWFSVDTFFFVSGLLVTLITMRSLDKLRNRPVGVLHMVLTSYVNRYFRLTPLLAALLAFNSTLYAHLGSGPMWKDVSYSQHHDKCRKYWWTLLLYVQNYVDIDEDPSQCIPQSWYLACDMQFFLVSPLFLIPLHKFRRAGKVLLSLLTVASMAVPGVITAMDDFPPMPILGTVNTDPMKYERYFYNASHNRMGPYVVGIWFGYLLHITKDREIKFGKRILAIGWLSAAVTLIALIQGVYRYQRFDSRLQAGVDVWIYAGISRSAWALALGWIVFACVNGQGGIVNDILSWKPFRPLGRLSYAGFLLSLTLQEMYIVSRKSPFHFDTLTWAYVYLASLVATIIGALPLSLIFESPFMVLSKVLMQKSRN